MNYTEQTRAELRRRREILVQSHEAFLRGEMNRVDLLAHIKASDGFARNVAVDIAMNSNSLIEPPTAEIIQLDTPAMETSERAEQIEEIRIAAE